MNALIQMLLMVWIFTLTACESQNDHSSPDGKKKSEESALEGQAVKSPVLDYSQFDGPPPNSTPAPKSAKPNPPIGKVEKEPSGFKKSPVLDYSKF